MPTPSKIKTQEFGFEKGKQLALPASEQQEREVMVDSTSRLELDIHTRTLQARQTQPEHIKAPAEIPEFDTTTVGSQTLADSDNTSLHRVSSVIHNDSKEGGFGDMISSYTADSSSTVEHLQRARKYGRLRLLRLRVPTLVIGSISVILGWWSQLVAVHPMLQGLGMFLLSFGFISCLMAVLPSDARCVWLIIGGVLIPGFFLASAFMCSLIPKQIVDIRNACNAKEEDVDETPCWIPFVYLSLNVFQILAQLGLAAFFVSILRKKLDAASRLRKIWETLCVALFVLAAINCVKSPFYAAFNDVEYTKWGTDICFRKGFDAIAFLFAGCMMRRYEWISGIQSWLMTQGEAATVAAAVAQLLGGQSPKEVLGNARKKFSSVKADRLTFADMSENKVNPALAALVDPARLGNVDAFVSHSWHDDPELKWNALQAWREDFKRRHKGREPNLWIDKYCIDQNTIKESLACLPVFLVGCQRLIVLCGNTYLSRLWCLIEIFVFLEMGGKLENLDVFLLESQSTRISKLERIRTELLRFDPSEACCTSEEDTQRLQGLIDVTGTSKIKKLVTDVFESKLSVSSMV